MPTASKVKQWTTGTAWQFTVTDGDGAAIDLTSATIQFFMRSQNADRDDPEALELAGSTSGLTPADGECKITWEATNLDDAGLYDCWLHITNGSEQYGNAVPLVLEIVPAPNPA